MIGIATTRDENDIVNHCSFQMFPWWRKLSALHLPPLQLADTISIRSHLSKCQLGRNQLIWCFFLPLALFVPSISIFRTFGPFDNCDNCLTKCSQFFQNAFSSTWPQCWCSSCFHYSNHLLHHPTPQSREEPEPQQYQCHTKWILLEAAKPFTHLLAV